jgi:lipopolysaccharide/colanic/teichoic acid biosynthesis glycosyltransferase
VVVIYKGECAGAGHEMSNSYKLSSRHIGGQRLPIELSTQNPSKNGHRGIKAAFVKIKGNPLLTKPGKFLRNSNLGKLPQLSNILFGGISLPGNKPLPVYIAEMLVPKGWSMRFLGPAGLTDYSFWLDLKILVRAVPTVLQK